MKKVIIASFLMFSFGAFAQKHKGKCEIGIEKTYTQKTFGKNIGYYVEFKNNASSAVDALEWKALFYNNFGELKGEKTGTWDAGNFIKPIKVGQSGKDLETSWVDDATKVFITITKVHFEDGKKCIK